MNKSELLAVLALSGLVLGGCVTTTTGSSEPETGDDAAEYNYQLGVRYLQNENYDLARDRLERALEIDPRLGKAHMTLGMTYERLGNLRLATESYESSVRVEPRNFELQNGYAVFLCKQRDYDKAKKHFNRAANHPENDTAATTLTNAGLCMQQKPDAAAAEAFYREALERQSNYGEALLQLCLLKFQQEDFLGSRAFLQRFMSANRTTAGVLFLAAEIEGKLGNDRGRTEYINQLLREFPESPEARRALSSS
ncbi:MAG: type IV pilus biogenesis/stability protein PilW [Woeseiaceae bacterium]|nr:type IV pilus biogenesis/stability protein PilW [Woeseiaceae bacterium]